MKHLSLLFVTLALAGILIIGCKNSNAKAEPVNSNSFDLSTMKKTIEEQNTLFAKAFVNGDSATLVDHYMADAKLFPENSDPIIGRAAIAKLISQYLKYGIKQFHD